jgi:hypothetical protein
MLFVSGAGVEAHRLEVLPFLTILVIPLMGRLSDFDSEVRQVSSRTFATLIQLMPLEYVARHTSHVARHTSHVTHQKQWLLHAHTLYKFQL